MIDINLIKDNPQAIIEKLKLRNYDFDLGLFESLEAKRKKYQTETENLQAKRNTLSKEYGLLKKEGKDDKVLSKNIESIKIDLDTCSNKLNEIQSSLKEFLLDVPNLPDDSVPPGADEGSNKKIREHGEPAILKGKDHLE